MAEEDPPPASPPAPVLQYASPTHLQKWKTVWTARDAFEANLAVNKLQSHGLLARVDFEATSALGAWGGGGPVGTKVQVLEDDVPSAKTLLEAIDLERQKRQAASMLQCPRCNAPARHAISTIRKVGLALLIGPIIVSWFGYLVGVEGSDFVCIAMLPGLALLIWPMTPRWRCAACGHRWSAPAPPEDADDEEEESGGLT